jgi:hypothetical protein
MTGIRARAYRRIVKTLRDVGPTTLRPAEQACIREAADAMLFSEDLDARDARQALASVTGLADDLVDARRWTPWRAMQLLDDLWACGPGWTALHR